MMPRQLHFLPVGGSLHFYKLPDFHVTRLKASWDFISSLSISFLGVMSYYWICFGEFFVLVICFRRGKLTVNDELCIVFVYENCVPLNS